MPNYVTKIRMRKGRIVSYNPLDIEGLYIGETYHTTQDVYFMLKKIEQEESEEKKYSLLIAINTLFQSLH